MTKCEALLLQLICSVLYLQIIANADAVELTDRIASCSATSNYSDDYTCQYSYDGTDKAAVHGAAWAMENGKGVGEWMEVNLDNEYVLNGIEMLPRCRADAQFSSMDISFSSGEVVQLSRTCGGTGSFSDCSGDSNAWFSVDLPSIKASSVKFEVTAVCATSPISVGIREMKLLGLENTLDITDRIASCSASSTYSEHYECQYSYDGTEIAAVHGAAWAMVNGKGVGEWMEVTLDNDYELIGIDMLPRCHEAAQFSSMDIHFSGGEVVQVSRTCGGTGSFSDCSGGGNAWFSVNLPNRIITSSVKFVVTAVCATSPVSVGIREMKLFAVDNVVVPH